MNKFKNMKLKDSLKIFTVILASLFFLYFRNIKNSYFIDDNYTNGIFKLISGILSTLSDKISISVGEVVFYAVVIIFFIMISKLFSKVLKHRYREAISEILNIAAIVAILLILFYISFGFNYRQVGVRYIFNIPNEKMDSSDLIRISKKITADTNEAAEKYYESLENSAESKTVNKGEKHGLEEAIKELNSAYKRISDDYNKLIMRETKPKAVFSSRILSKLGITGIYFPYTAEANYNNDIPSVFIPGVIAHEMAHQRGIAAEDECNFLMYLVSNYTNNYYVKYSVLLNTEIYFLNEVARLDSEEYKKIYDSLTIHVKKDLDENSKYWKQFEGKVMEKSQKVNDNYLKINGEAGIESYNSVVKMIIDYLKKTETQNN